MVREAKLSAVLTEFARTMVTDFPIQRILDHLVVRIVDVLPVTSAGVTLIEPGRAPRYVAASDDSALRYEQLQTKIGEGPCLVAYESGEAVMIPDLSVEKRFPQFAPAAVADGLAAVFTFPLRHGDGRLGALDLYRESVGDLDSDDMAAAQTLADVASAYLINAQAREEDRRNVERLETLTLHDELTGLPNRTLLEQRLVHAAQRATRGHLSAAVLFADLDGFKSVNDAYGHQFGNDLLIAVSQRLLGLIRRADTLARISGDEFVFLFEEVRNTADAETLATRVGKAFAAPFSIDQTEIEQTASIGIAFAGPGDEISETLITEADAAMYRAKRDGGDGHALDLRSTNPEPPNGNGDPQQVTTSTRVPLPSEPTESTLKPSASDDSPTEPDPSYGGPHSAQFPDRLELRVGDPPLCGP